MAKKIEYFSDPREVRTWMGGNRTQSFHLTAVGSEPNPEGNLPIAEIRGIHRYGVDRANFQPHYLSSFPEATRETGLSDHYLTKKRRELESLRSTRHSRNSNWTPEHQKAYLAVRYAIRHGGVSNQFESPQFHPVVKKEFATNPHLSPDTLFHEEQAPETSISEMFVDPAMRVSGLTLAGIVQDRYNSTPITASHDLSEDSSRLVQRAVDRGLSVKTDADNPLAEQTNTIASGQRNYIQPQELTTIRHNRQEIPQDQVQRGRRVVRGMLRPSRGQKSQSAPSTDQPLPGMEKYL